MDGSRFDTWTRRKFGLVAGSAAVASLLGIASLPEAEARKKKRRKRCRKLGQTCDINRADQQCCKSGQDCAQVQGISGNVCCKERFASCSFNEDCCGTRKCNRGSCE